MYQLWSALCVVNNLEHSKFLYLHGISSLGFFLPLLFFSLVVTLAFCRVDSIATGMSPFPLLVRPPFVAVITPLGLSSYGKPNTTSPVVVYCPTCHCIPCTWCSCVFTRSTRDADFDIHISNPPRHPSYTPVHLFGPCFVLVWLVLLSFGSVWPYLAMTSVDWPPFLFLFSLVWFLLLSWMLPILLPLPPLWLSLMYRWFHVKN